MPRLTTAGFYVNSSAQNRVDKINEVEKSELKAEQAN